MSSYGLEIIGAEECRALLRAGQVGRVAVCGARPGVFPVLYSLLDDDVVFRTAPGEKLIAAAAGPRRRVRDRRLRHVDALGMERERGRELRGDRRSRRARRGPCARARAVGGRGPRPLRPDPREVSGRRVVPAGCSCSRATKDPVRLLSSMLLVRYCACGRAPRAGRDTPAPFGRGRRRAARRRRTGRLRCSCCSTARCGSRRTARRSRPVTEPGACVGEMSLLLGVSATADVVASRTVGGRRHRRRAARCSSDDPACARAGPAARAAPPGDDDVSRRHQAAVRRSRRRPRDGRRRARQLDAQLGLAAARARSERDPIPSTSADRSATARPRRTSLLDPGQRRPPRALRVGVELDARRDRTDLAAGVEHQRRADPIDPRTAGRERRLVHVPAQHDARADAARSTRRAPRRRSAACRSSSSATSSGGAWYTQIHCRSPTSAASAASWRSTTSRVRGPSHHGHTVTITLVGEHMRAVDEDTRRRRAASSHAADRSPSSLRALRS